MENAELILHGVIVVFIIGCVFDISIFLRDLINNLYNDFKEINDQKVIQYQNKNIHEAYENDLEMIKLSHELLEFTKQFIADVSLYEFKKFSDSQKDIIDITKINIENIIKETAEIIMKSIDIENIPFDYLIFNREYYNRYIVQTTIIMIKRLFEKSVYSEAEENPIII